MENPPKEFAEASNTLDARPKRSTKEEVPECARPLALNLAHYKIRFGKSRWWKMALPP